jgi:signal transduction histidine kinase
MRMEGTSGGWRRTVQTRPGLPWVALRYAMGALVPLAVALLMGALPNWFRSAPLFLFVAAVFVVAWVAGPRPASLSAALSSVLALRLFLPVPPSQFGASNLGPLAFFAVVSAGIIYLTGRLQRLERQARMLSQAREEFLSAAAHELRSPLAALQLQIDVLEREVQGRSTFDGTWLRERAGRLRRQVERLRKLLDVLMDIARLQAGRLQLERTRVDLAEVARAVVARLAEEQTTPCELHIRADGPVVGRWDRARLDQVVTNLLSNACKYGEGKPVQIRIAAENGTAKLVVRDEGIGIAPEDTARIFERFERVADNLRFEGMGVGLWIARQIVQAHGGQIHVDSAPGGGATFTVELNPDAEREHAP